MQTCAASVNGRESSMDCRAAELTDLRCQERIRSWHSPPPIALTISYTVVDVKHLPAAMPTLLKESHRDVPSSFCMLCWDPVCFGWTTPAVEPVREEPVGEDWLFRRGGKAIPRPRWKRCRSRPWTFVSFFAAILHAMASSQFYRKQTMHLHKKRWYRVWWMDSVQEFKLKQLRSRVSGLELPGCPPPAGRSP